MVARLLTIALALLPAFARAADSTNAAPPAISVKSPADIEGSPEWVRKSLQQQDSDAVVDLGYKYLSGDGVPKDEKKAIFLFVSAAAVDNAPAKWYIGRAFANGIGLPRNEARALDWLKAAAMDGYAPAQSDFGRDLRTRVNQPSDYSAAFSWIAHAAAQGYPAAEADLGAMYQTGEGVKVDIVESLKWLQLAADAGFKDAVFRRDEVMSLMDPAQKLEAKRRAESFKPETGSLTVVSEIKVTTCSLGNYFQIPVRILGETKSMIADTGATYAFFDLSFQGHIEEPMTSAPVSTVTSSTADFKCGICPEIFIDESRFAPLLAVVSDFTKIRQASGELVDGFLGMSCLKYHVLCFDSDHDTFSIGGSVPATVKRDALSIPLISSNGDFGIEVFINGHGPVFLAIDSGDTGPISLNDSDWKKVFAGQPANFIRGKNMDAEGKINDDRNARLQSMTVGTNKYTNLIADSLVNPNLPSHLGQEFLHRHISYLDFPNGMLYLLPSRQFSRSEEADMSGLHLWEINGKIMVQFVTDDSPALQAGIRADDQILSLNRQDVASLHLKSIREILKSKPGDEIKMEVKRGQQTNSVEFVLKRLI